MSLNKFWSFVLILIFGGAIVAIGTRELKRELAKGKDQQDLEQTQVLLKDLKGDVDLARASLRRREEVEQSRPSETKKTWIERAISWVTP